VFVKVEIDRVMARSRYKFLDNDFPYFIACTVINWIPIFSNPHIVQIVLNSFTFLQEEKRLILNAYVITENHLHCVAQSANISKEVAAFKSFTGRSIVDHYKQNHNQFMLFQFKQNKKRFKTDRKFQVWQEGSHPKQIQNDKMLQQKIHYIHYNPVRRGYVELPEHWRYSSAKNYMDQAGLIPVTKPWS
jgi:REP-associated tyrosine transposase